MKQNDGITNTKCWNNNKYFSWSRAALAVSSLTNDSIRQEIKCYFCQLFQLPLKKNGILLPVDKVEDFVKKLKKADHG